MNLSGSAYSQFDGNRVEFTGAQHNQLSFLGFRQGIHYAPNKPYNCLEVDFWPLHEIRQRLMYRLEPLETHIGRVAAGQTFALGPARPLVARL